MVCLLVTINLTAQSNPIWDDKPLWLRIDDAIEKVESNETGDAVYLFRKILEDYPENPESEMWLGLIFDKENEYELSLKHLELALEHKTQLVILEDQFTILYKMAEIYFKQGNFSSYTENLNRVIKYSGEAISNNNLKKVMLNVLQKRGYDKFIELYRPMSKISLKAYGYLGKYYFQIGDWDTAIEYLMLATASTISISIEELKIIDPDYKFLSEDNTDTNRDSISNKSFIKLLDQVNSHLLLKDYFKRNSFYEYFYYLGKSLQTSGFDESGSYILENIYIRPESGKWGFLSNPR